MAELIRRKEDTGGFRNLYTEYGIRLVKGSYDTLLKYPPKKSYLTNSSRLQDGVRYITTASYSKFDEKSFSIEFILYANSSVEFYSRLAAFLEVVSSGMFELKITTLNKVFRLVYTDCQRLETFKKKWAIFELSLVEPDPTDRNEEATPDPES